MEGPGVALFEELAKHVAQGVSFGNLFVHPIIDDAGGRIVAEEVVDRGGQFEPSFVAVPLDSLEPLGIDHAGAEYSEGFFF